MRVITPAVTHADSASFGFFKNMPHFGSFKLHCNLEEWVLLTCVIDEGTERFCGMIQQTEKWHIRAVSPFFVRLTPVGFSGFMVC